MNEVRQVTVTIGKRLRCAAEETRSFRANVAYSLVPPSQASIDEFVAELDMLLTGGRFADVTKSLIREAVQVLS